MDDQYLMLRGPAEGLYKEKGSKFIALAMPVHTEEEVKEALVSIRKKYFDARHHCYAWVLGPKKELFRANDDGEPSGSAGKPILNQIYSADVTNVLLVVVRYFGGVKLGVSGLVNAYKTAAREALSQADIETKTVDEIHLLSFDWPLMNEVMRVLREENLQPYRTRFEQSCELEVKCRSSQAKRVIEKIEKIYGVRTKYLFTT